MQSMPINQVVDFDFNVHNKRQQYEITQATIYQRVRALKCSKHFSYIDNAWAINDYVGYAFVCMLKDQRIINYLIDVQNLCLKALKEEGVMFALPPESFHQTIANLLSNQNFHESIVQQGLEESYPEILQHAINELPNTNPSEESVEMSLIGLTAFGSCIAVLGTIEEKTQYQKVMGFREGIYTNPSLNQLNIARTRPFVGHITLFYVAKPLTGFQKNCLCSIINDCNTQLQQQQFKVKLNEVQLRAYKNLTQFLYQQHFPIHQL